MHAAGIEAMREILLAAGWVIGIGAHCPRCASKMRRAT